LRALFSTYRSFVDLGTVTLSSTLGQLHHVPWSVLVHMLVVAILASLEWSQGDRPTYADVLDIGETTTHHQFVIKT
jgi:hypothetical protein